MELQNVFVEPTVPEEKQEPLPLILTRYLYIKQDVMISLLLSITNKDWQQSLFWTCELYHSGFQEELTEFVYIICRDCFQTNNPKLWKYVDREFHAGKTDLLTIATMVRNMTVPARIVDAANIPGLDEYVDQEDASDTKTVETRLFIHVQESDLASHATVERSPTLPARLILKQVCRYPTNKKTPDLTTLKRAHEDIPRESLVTMHRFQWLYYACQSPIWMDRLEKHHGYLNHDDLSVVFDNLTDEETFYEQYEYEPDEQSLAVQSMFMYV
jgi:hypothetical protein